MSEELYTIARGIQAITPVILFVGSFLLILRH